MLATRPLLFPDMTHAGALESAAEGGLLALAACPAEPQTMPDVTGGSAVTGGRDSRQRRDRRQSNPGLGLTG